MDLAPSRHRLRSSPTDQVRFQCYARAGLIGDKTISNSILNATAGLMIICAPGRRDVPMNCRIDGTWRIRWRRNELTTLSKTIVPNSILGFCRLIDTMVPGFISPFELVSHHSASALNFRYVSETPTSTAKVGHFASRSRVGRVRAHGSSACFEEDTPRTHLDYTGGAIV